MTGPEPVALATAPPFNARVLFDFLRRWAVPGVELVDERDGQLRYARAVRLARGPGLIRVTWTGGRLLAELRVQPGDEAEATAKIRSLCDLDADPATIDDHLGRDPHLAETVAAAPGLRIPGTTDPDELAFQVLIGQQISMAAAVTCAAKITDAYGELLAAPGFGLTRLFPTAAALAEVDPTELPMVRARGRALVGLARALTEGIVDLSGAWPLAEARKALLALPGIGPWTADSIAMRALADTDVLLATDLVIKRELSSRGVTDATAWAPYRSYATLHLWRPYVS